MQYLASDSAKSQKGGDFATWVEMMLSISHFKIKAMRKPYMAMESMLMIRNKVYHGRGGEGRSHGARLSILDEIKLKVCEQMILSQVLENTRANSTNQGENGLGKGSELLLNV
jgi:hypothetical protein